MNLLIIVFVIVILFLLNIFYNSFIYEEDIYFFTFRLSPIEWLITFYLLLLSTLYLIFKKFELGFVLLQVLMSSSLFFIGEYTYVLLLQFVFLAVFFDIKKPLLKTIYIFVYLLALHKGLLLLFSSSYFLYFINLSLVIYTLFLKHYLFTTLSKKNILACGIILSIIIFSINNWQNLIFDLYIWLDVVDTQMFGVKEVFYILSFIHISIFTSLLNIDIIKKII